MRRDRALSRSRRRCDKRLTLAKRKNDPVLQRAIPLTLDERELLAEERKLRRLKRAMDVAATLLRQVDLTLEEAQDVVHHAKSTAA